MEVEVTTMESIELRLPINKEVGTKVGQFKIETETSTIATMELVNTEIKRSSSYYPIDPWTLEGVLFNCSAISLKIS